MSYEASDPEAVHNAGRLIRAGAQSVKLEGGVERAGRIAAIVNAGIPVIGHIGVGPQTAALDRGLGSLVILPVHGDVRAPAIRVLIRAVKGGKAYDIETVKSKIAVGALPNVPRQYAFAVIICRGPCELARAMLHLQTSNQSPFIHH